LPSIDIRRMILNQMKSKQKTRRMTAAVH
jgi:hypothetical protein